jgi:hypothetical protein
MKTLVIVTFCKRESQILIELKSINLSILTPIEALNILRNWKKNY